MAENEEKPVEEEASEEKAGGGGKKKLIIIGAIVGVLIIGGGGAAFFLMSGGDSADTKSASQQDDTSETKDAKDPNNPEAATTTKDDDASVEETTEEKKDENLVDFGQTYTLKPFQLNLGNPLENHFIRLEISLEYRGGEEQKKEIEQRIVQLRDAVGAVTSKKTREFLLSPDGRDQLRREILIRINRYMTKPIEAVFISDMLIE